MVTIVIDSALGFPKARVIRWYSDFTPSIVITCTYVCMYGYMYMHGYCTSKIEKSERVRVQTLARQNVLTCYRNDKHVGKREFTWSETWQRQREITRSSMLTVPCDLYKAGFHTRLFVHRATRCNDYVIVTSQCLTILRFAALSMISIIYQYCHHYHK